MLQSVGGYVSFGAQVLEQGLAHSTFLGRVVSWGIFYGAVYFCAKKIYQYAVPKIKEYLESRKSCENCRNVTPKGEPVTPVEPNKTREGKKEFNPVRQNSQQPGELFTSQVPVPSDNTTLSIPNGVEGDGVKKK